MTAGRDATGSLIRALTRSARAAGLALDVAGARSAEWASATFTGERVEVALNASAAIHTWLAVLEEAELELSGWCVADLAVAGAGSAVTLEALVLRSA